MYTSTKVVESIRFLPALATCTTNAQRTAHRAGALQVIGKAFGELAVR